MRQSKLIFVILGIILILSSFANAQGPDLLPVPNRLDGHHREELAARRSQLEVQWNILVSKSDNHDKECGKVPANTPLANKCRQQMNSLLDEIVAHREAVKNFNDMVDGLVEIMEARSRRFDWQKLRDGTYLGTGIGEEVAQWYADNYAATGHWYYGLGGLAASLWTPDTYLETLAALVTAEVAGAYFGRSAATQATEAAATGLRRGLSVAERSRIPTSALRPPGKFYDFPTHIRGSEPNIPKWLFRENPYQKAVDRLWYWQEAGSVRIPRTPTADKVLQWVLTGKGRIF
jgi:hypothetical protein